MKSTKLPLRAFLFDSHGVSFIETQNLAAAKQNWHVRDGDLVTVEFNSILFH